MRPAIVPGFETTMVRTGRARDGIMYDANKLEAWMAAGGSASIMLGRSNAAMRSEGDYKMTDIVKAYSDAEELIRNAQNAYRKLVNEFRSSIKNDLTSISSSADRVQRENEKMRDAYGEASKMLTSPEMEKAIANAERLASALHAISALQSHSITFAVLDKKSKTVEANGE